MKTERLYYDDPYLLEFDANVVETRSADGRFEVILDKTAFYPTSGGQPNDLGTLNDVALINCVEDETSGVVVHVLGGAIDIGPVHCRIDAARRADHMQQHSGQHVLSQAFVELFNWPTVSFHLGVIGCTIDLAAEVVSREQAEMAEDFANRIVRENRSVAIRYASQENIAEVGLRKPTERAGDIRIIDIAGYDRSACGGTHVRTTGEIGAVLITGLERAKKQTRVHFLCGDRVIRYARSANRTLEAISQTISAPPLETAAGVRGLWNENQQARKRIEELESQLIDYEAAQFPISDGVAVGSFLNRGIDKLKMLAVKICSRSGVVALLADQSDQLRVVFARSADSTVDAGALLKQTVERFGGRGGGRPNLAQGGGLSGSAQEVLEFARRLL
ncbi:MAG TPA: alanyl-tRNA editing protein [Terriglobia bacterium]|nr:alanyl-tRNA editing protein [Terriglobia bacterium]